MLYVESFGNNEPNRVLARSVSGGGVQVNWSSGNGAVLIARNAEGQVLALDRQGDLTLTRLSQGSSIEIAGPGIKSQSRMLSELTRDGDWLLER